MVFVRDGQEAPLEAAALAASVPPCGPRIVVLVHGLMNTETIWELPDGGDYGSYLQRDAGFTPFYVRYNSGLAIVDNGAALARLLDGLVRAYPVPIEEILLLGYSMGGLVVRSACAHGTRDGQGATDTTSFLSLVHRAIYVGTPHHGAPYERLGRAVSSLLHAVDDPYTRLIGDLADLRSAGLQDLGDADLRHEDRERRAADAPGLRLADWRHPVPLLPQLKHHLIAGSLVDAPWLRELFGDSVVPVGSALAGASHEGGPEWTTPVRLLPGLSHVALAHDPAVYAQILAWVNGLPGATAVTPGEGA